jgi:hypothetical protein
MMTRGCMHAPLSIKKVMSMQCVCMHPLAIIIKQYLSTPSMSVKLDDDATFSMAIVPLLI